MTQHTSWIIPGETRQGGLITRTWTDPCPDCGGEVTGVDADAITVTDNPEAVISIPSPACRYDRDDPDSPDCICTTIINPAPDPFRDEVHVVGYTYTLRPCGHTTHRTIRFYQQTRPAPGTLGELMADWAALDEEEGER